MESKFKIVSDPSTFVSALAFFLDVILVRMIRPALAELAKERVELFLPTVFVSLRLLR